MAKVRTVLLNKGILDDNDKEADRLKSELTKRGTFLVNVMSSPGAGKTTALIALIDRLKIRCKIGVMEADIDSDVDAVKVAERTGVKSVQLHTGGMCHLDAEMTAQGLNALKSDGLELVFLENVGNLVCPAEFDTGAHLNMMILSVPEGDDKPLKYPLVFGKCDLIVISKIDTAPYFTFDLERCKSNIALRNPSAEVIVISAKTGEGMDELEKYFIAKLEKEKKSNA